ncbi:MAG: glycosyltransferase [Acidobacteriia bacterium]|nr:glycosyltransferase [Terriglobia bacterium]
MVYLHALFLMALLAPLVLWWGMLLDWLLRGRDIERLAELPADVLPNLGWPSMTVIVPARDEERSIEPALRSLATQDYPGLKIVVVDDRSTDQTASLLLSLSREFSTISIETIRELPSGWLGKTHALWRGAQRAGQAKWFLFTDADVVYEPASLRRAVRYAEAQGIDLLTLYPGLILGGFWERAVIASFGLLSFVAYAPWRVNNPQSGAYFATGAFNLVRREAYERAGGHRPLALEVIDDARLCWLMKQAGARVKVIIGLGAIRVRWQVGVAGIVQGLTKNFFAGFNYSLAKAIAGSAGILLFSVVPFFGMMRLPHLSGWLSAASVVALFALYQLSSRGTGVSFLFATTHPLGAMVMIFIIFRSAFVTLMGGGVTWRGTHYSLRELKEGRRSERTSSI